MIDEEIQVEEAYKAACVDATAWLKAREIQKESDPERRKLLLREADQEDVYDDMLDGHSLSGKRLAYVLDIEARLREPLGLHDILRQEREHRENLADLTARGNRYRSSGVSNHDAETMKWARGSMLLQERRMEMEMKRAAKCAKIEEDKLAYQKEKAKSDRDVREKELNMRKKELDVREKELDMREKELDMREKELANQKEVKMHEIDTQKAVELRRLQLEKENREAERKFILEMMERMQKWQ